MLAQQQQQRQTWLLFAACRLFKFNTSLLLINAQLQPIFILLVGSLYYLLSKCKERGHNITF